MPTIEEVKKQRKEFDGREMHQRFFAYCEAHGLAGTEDVLADWDEKHNESRIRLHFGSREDVYRVGLLELYRRFLVSYSIKVVNGPIVTLPSGKKYQPYVRETRMVDGVRLRLEKITASNLNAIREAFRVAVRQLLRTQKFFNLPAREIRAIVLAELEAVEEEKV